MLATADQPRRVVAAQVQRVLEERGAIEPGRTGDRTGELLQGARLYEEQGEFARAAALYEQTGDRDKAAELYHRVGRLESAGAK